MRIRPWDVVLFDLDGTLIDSIALIRESLAHTLRAHGLEVPPDAVLMAGVGQPLENQMRRWARDPEEAAAMAATYRAYNLAIHDDRVHAFDGIAPGLERLHGRGVPLGVVTSKRSDGARRGLEVTGLAPWFGTLVASDHVTRGKPDREPLDRALRELGADGSARAVYVGDSLHDVEAAHAASIDAIAVTWGVADAALLARARPAHVVDTVAALFALLLP